jgi:PTH2 family peptidyl-tRNA hydrolase
MKLNKKQKELLKSLKMDVKMLFVCNMSLKMGKGKVAAQVGHCTIDLYKELLKKGNNNLLEAWENTGSKKIVTKVKTEKEMGDLRVKAENLGIIYHIVTDAGKTQIAEGSQTVLGFVGPSNKLNQFTKHLKLM